MHGVTSSKPSGLYNRTSMTFRSNLIAIVTTTDLERTKCPRFDMARARRGKTNTSGIAA
jgi:hypothetical protein